jgi:putative ubiquitin-RnfH superfamily antitoxin RatB of RatAB toxin-antitoxin module
MDLPLNVNMAGLSTMIGIQIVDARPERSIVKSLRLAQGARIADALDAAATDADFGGVDLKNSPVGIFGRLAQKDQLLKDGDRIEIYRPLVQEPKLARRARAGAAKSPRGSRR